eukprot:5863395-Pleurochrysis_carterae.AAC.1
MRASGLVMSASLRVCFCARARSRTRVPACTVARALTAEETSAKVLAALGVSDDRSIDVCNGDQEWHQ